MEALFASDGSCFLGLQLFGSHVGSSADGIFHSGEEGITQLGGNRSLHAVDVVLDLLIVVEKPLQLIAKLFGIELRNLYRLLVGTTSFLAQTRLVPSHKFRATESTKPIEFSHWLGQLFTGYLSELLNEPV